MVFAPAHGAGVQRTWYEPYILGRAWILPTVLALVALAVRLWCFTGLIASDDVVYAHYAHGLASGHYVPEANQWATRLGLLLPLAGIYALLGVSEATTAFFPLLASVVSVVLVFLIARRQFGVTAGLVAAILMLSFPLSIRYGSILIPETIAELYILAAFWLYLRARDGGDVVAAVFAGVSLGVAYLTRELAVFILCALLIEAAGQRRWRLLLAVAAGSFAVVLGEHLYYWFATGDLWFRIHSMAAHNRRRDAYVFLQHPGWRFFRALPHMMLIPSLSFGLHSLVAIVFTAISIFTFRLRNVSLFVFWAFIPLLYLNFGTTSFHSYIAVPLSDPRYLELIYPPLFILSGAWLAAVLQRENGRIYVTATVALLAVTGMFCAHATRATGWKTAHISRLRAIAKSVKNESGAIVGFEGPSARAWRYSIEVIDSRIIAANLQQRGFVLLPDSEGLPVSAAQPWK